MCQLHYNFAAALRIKALLEFNIWQLKSWRLFLINCTVCQLKCRQFSHGTCILWLQLIFFHQRHIYILVDSYICTIFFIICKINKIYNEFSLSSRSPVAPSCQGFDFRDLRMFTLLMFEAQPITSKQLPNFLMIIIKTSDKLFWTFLMWIFYMKQQHDNVLHVQRKRKDRLYPQTISSTSNISSYVFLAIQGCNNNTFSDLLRLASRLVLANKKTRSKPSRLDTTTGFFYYNGPKVYFS